MPYTVNDFYREFTRSHLDWLNVQERLQGLSHQERLKGIPPEERLRDLSPEEILDALLSGDVLAHVSPETREQFVQKLRHHNRVVAE